MSSDFNYIENALGELSRRLNDEARQFCTGNGLTETMYN